MKMCTNFLRLMMASALSLIFVVAIAQQATPVLDQAAPVNQVHQTQSDAATLLSIERPDETRPMSTQQITKLNNQPSVSLNGALGVTTELYLDKPMSNEVYDQSKYPTPKQGGDNIATATVITSLPYTNTGTTTGYTNSYDAVCPYTGSTAPDVVYSFTPGTNMAINVDLCGSLYDTKLYIFENTAGNLIACNDDYYFGAPCGIYVSALFNVPVTSGNTYYIIVDGYGTDNGTYTIAVTQGTVYPVPANDECTNATVVSTFPASLTGTNLGATVDCPGVLDWNAVWYELQLPYAINNVKVEYCGTDATDSPSYGIVYFTACNDCPNYILANTWNFLDCGDDNMTLFFNNVAGPTSIFFPAYIDPPRDFDITFTVTEVFGGSGCEFTSMYPGAPVPAAANQDVVTITTCNYAGEYAVVSNIQIGETYQFTFQDIGTGAYITLRDGAPTGANILTMGTSPITWTATYSGSVYVHYSLDDLCNTDFSCHITTVQCTTCPDVQCIVTCDPGNIDENEPDIPNEGADVTNGGCNLTTPLFSPISIGDGITGFCNTYTVAGADNRDLDWYRLDLSTETDPWNITFTVEAEFTPVIFLVDAGIPEDCSNIAILTSASGAACDIVSYNWTVFPGVYYLIVGPTVFTGYASGDGPTAGRWQYCADLTGFPATVTWENGANSPFGSYLGTAVGMDDYVYTIAGNSVGLNEFARYNPFTDVWQTLPVLPVQRRVNASAAADGKVYHFGGSDGASVYQTSSHVFNVATNNWSLIAPLPNPLGWHKAVAYGDDYIYIAGGYIGTGTAYENKVWLYNIAANTYTACTPMPGERIGGAFSLASGSNYLVYVGGADPVASIVATTFVGEIDPMDPTIITWTTETAYPGGTMFRFDGAPWCDGQVVFATGSPTGAWTPANPNPTYAYEPATDTWTQLADLTIPVLAAYVGSATSGAEKALVVASGYTGAAIVTNTQILFEECGYRVFGNVYYGNTGTTKPMDMLTTLTLEGHGSVSTGTNGYFEFNGVPDGNYTLVGTAAYQHGGMQTLDGILCSRAVGGVLAFSNLQFRSADVNMSSTLQNVDCTFIRRRAGGIWPITQWIAPDFVFDGPFSGPPALQGLPVSVSGGDVNIGDFRSLCSGDVNGSLNPLTP